MTPPSFALRFLLLLVAVPCVWVRPEPASAQEVPYEVELVGVEDDELRELLIATSRLFELEDEPPPSPIGLRRRIEADRGRLQAALRSLGYYAADLDVAVEEEPLPARVLIEVEPGPRYRIEAVAVEPVEAETLPIPPPPPDVLGLAPGDPAVAAQVVAAEALLIAYYAERGYAHAQVPERRVVVDHADRTMAVTYFLEARPLVRLGELRVVGVETFDEEVVRRRRPWEPGELYDPDLIEELRESVAALPIIRAARATIAEDPGPDGLTPVSLVVAERPPRVVGAGVSFSTTEGFGANVYWAHRNLFGGAERLRIEAEVARVGANTVEDTDLGLTATFTKPDFLATNQTLILDASLVSEHPEAFERDALVLGATLERPLARGVVLGYGVTFERSRIVDRGVRTDSLLAGTPVSLAIDRTDDLLNPTEGWRLDLATTPYAQWGDESGYFVASRATGSAYWGIDEEDRFVLAGLATIGSIVGSDLREIPADKRFYAGGGGTIRGYGFQEVGPEDEFGDPLGGRSLFAASAELRIRVTESIGVVPFVDVGNAYRTTFPDFGEGLRYAAGLGLRYYTGIGPLRADVAFPLDPEEDEDAFQFYISFGQAF